MERLALSGLETGQDIPEQDTKLPKFEEIVSNSFFSNKKF